MADLKYKYEVNLNPNRTTEWYYFSAFLDVATANLDTLLAMLIPPPKGCGKLLHSDPFCDPFPCKLEAVLSQAEACQLILHPLEQEKVCWSQVGRAAGCCGW